VADERAEGLPGGLHQLLERVGFELTTVDQLLLGSTRPVAQVLADLSALEMAGLIVRGEGGYIRS
jgi:predicted Rossmann fold nucleotide-binding protein DprA/Smf involved in DNA uptake